MRIWDIPPKILCRQHLLGEHRELHAIWTILTQRNTGYRKHPETLRWQNCLSALFRRHEHQVQEMRRRGYQHHSPLNKRQATGCSQQRLFVHTPREQRKILWKKGCECLLQDLQ